MTSWMVFGEWWGLLQILLTHHCPKIVIFKSKKWHCINNICRLNWEMLVNKTNTWLRIGLPKFMVWFCSFFNLHQLTLFVPIGVQTFLFLYFNAFFSEEHCFVSAVKLDFYSLWKLISLLRQGGIHSSCRELCTGLAHTQYLHISRQSQSTESVSCLYQNFASCKLAILYNNVNKTLMS